MPRSVLLGPATGRQPSAAAQCTCADFCAAILCTDRWRAAIAADILRIGVPAVRRRRAQRDMPYAELAALPEAVREHLPKHAQAIYKEAFNSA